LWQFHMPVISQGLGDLGSSASVNFDVVHEIGIRYRLHCLVLR
jgi:hypothetical protein